LQVVDVFDTVGLTLASNDDRIEGRTTLQKLIYFETVKIPEIQLKEPYFAYFYGPFNKDVAKSVEQMVVFDILEEHRTRNNHGSYVYKVSDKGIPVVNKLVKKFGKTFDKIEDIVNTCNEYCGLDPNPLSFAAKVHFMMSSQKSKKTITNNELVKTGKSLDWKLSKSDIKKGAELLDQLDLVKINR